MQRLPGAPACSWAEAGRPRGTTFRNMRRAGRGRRRSPRETEVPEAGAAAYRDSLVRFAFVCSPHYQTSTSSERDNAFDYPNAPQTPNGEWPQPGRAGRVPTLPGSPRRPRGQRLEAYLASGHGVAQFGLVVNERHQPHVGLDEEGALQDQHAVGLSRQRALFLGLFDGLD